jgi:outer membrane protein insertion porin family
VVDAPCFAETPLPYPLDLRLPRLLFAFLALLLWFACQPTVRAQQRELATPKRGPAPAAEAEAAGPDVKQPGTEPGGEADAEEKDTDPEAERDADAEADADSDTDATEETDAEGDADAEPAEPVALRSPKTICEGRRINEIRVQGHGRVAADDIRATMKLRPGVPCTDAEVTKDVRAIWNLGYFDDITVEARVEKKGVNLLFRVRERPAVASIVYEGNEELDESDFEEKVTLEQGAVLSIPEVREQLNEIRDLYAEEGFFLARVDYRLVPKTNNQVEVRFLIDEGEEVTVRRIVFLGNENLDDSDLKSVMQTGETGFFSFLSSSNNFQRQNFEEDINRIRALYYDRGYLTVHVVQPLIELTPDRRHIDITIRIKEGPRFKIKSIGVKEVDKTGKEVEPLAGRKNLREQIHLDPGDWFSSTVIQRDLQEITRFYRDRGYAFVNISPQTELHTDERLVDVLVSIERGPLVYVQRINIKGNQKTRDEVIRRELRIAESDLYNQTRVERSKRRVTALGYFENVEVSEQRGSQPNRIVINFEVAERPTGTFQVGAGFSSLETFLFTGQVQQQNLFGRGQTLAFNLQLSGIRQLMQIQFVEPYLFGSEWHMGVDGFRIMRQLRDYNRDSTGASLTLGHPLWFIHEDLRLFLNYRLEDVEITPATGGVLGGAGQSYYLFRTIPLRNLFRSGLTSSMRLSLQWDSRDDRLFPTSGVLATISTELSEAFLGSDNNFLRHEARFRYYHPLFWGMVGKLNTEWGLITSRDPQGVPVFERYFLGGIFDLRGFSLQSVGPRIALPLTLDPGTEASTRGTSIGGNMQFHYNLELEFPIIEAVGIKGVLFNDGGNAWNLERPLCEEVPEGEVGDPATDPCGVHPLLLRTSVGFGFRWFSPLGPLRFEWGYPLNPRRPYEDTYEFQFTVGNQF